MTPTFFLHIPKTGGTSIDSLLAAAFDPERSLRGLQMSSAVRHWSRPEHENFEYLSGHVPAGCVDLDRFGRRITVLRPPREMLASFCQYSRRISGARNFLDELAASGRQYAAYHEYFAPAFDRDRFVTEMRYGVPLAQHSYAEPCSVPQALETLARFDEVLDFTRLDHEAMRLVMEGELFPPAAMPRRRQHAYPAASAASAAAEALLSPFDIEFYDAARERFRPLPGDIEARYALYRQRWTQAHGIWLEPARGLAIDLREPVGSGWLDAERSELGDTFRWAVTPRATLELPLARPGRYVLRLYVHPQRVQGLCADWQLVATGSQGVLRREDRQSVTILEAAFEAGEPGWLEVRFDGEVPAESADLATEVDARAFILGRALLRRPA